MVNYFDFQDLADKLKSGEFSAVDTLHAYQWKAIQVNKRQNCVTQFLEDSEDEAKKCDEIPVDGNYKHLLPLNLP